jgi:hypothetical protein
MNHPAKRSNVNSIIRYYLVILPLYVFELTLVVFLESIVDNIVVTNFLIKSFLTIMVSIWLKKNLFEEKKYFYITFFLICILNPFFASFLLFLIYKLEIFNLMVSKIFADIFLSLLTYIGLRALPS